MSTHELCDPDKTTRASELFSSKLKGRILSEEDLRVPEQVLKMAKAKDQKVRFYDISQTTDKIRALKRAAFKTPTVVMNEQPYQDLEKIYQAISDKFDL